LKETKFDLSEFTEMIRNLKDLNNRSIVVIFYLISYAGRRVSL